VNYLTVSIKLRKEFKIDNPVQAERSSGYTVQVPSELVRSSILYERDEKMLFKLALDSSPYGVVERCMLYPELRCACSGLSILDSLRSLGMKNKQHVTVLLSRFVVAVSACTRYCMRVSKKVTLPYFLEK
jgi:hypothetical protein